MQPGVVVSSCSGIATDQEIDKLLQVYPTKLVQEKDAVFYYSQNGLLIGSAPIEINQEDPPKHANLIPEKHISWLASTKMAIASWIENVFV